MAVMRIKDPATGKWVVYTIDGIDGKDGSDGRDGVDGRDGIDGKDGVTPHIGANKNWYIGDIDTGISSEGKDGRDGTDGKDGDTPYIYDDYWYVGENNTGVKAVVEDYVLTPDDKREIVDSVMLEIDMPDNAQLTPEIYVGSESPTGEEMFWISPDENNEMSDDEKQEIAEIAASIVDKYLLPLIGEVS